MRSAKRTRQYKILAGVIFGLIIFGLISLVVDSYQTFDDHSFELDQKINEANCAFALKNSFGFTDTERSLVKPHGTYRIAVLGDSFVWGDGLPYNKVWTHKLEAKLQAAYDSVEVLSWGKDGWSTLDEINFYKQHGKDYHPDLLIIGWVDNDPDMGKIAQIKNMGAEVKFPLTYKVCAPLARSLLNISNGNSYEDWIEALYTPANLKDYAMVWQDFHELLAQTRTPCVVIMTPAASYNAHKEYAEMAAPIITQAGFPCYNLIEPVEKKLGTYTCQQLQANPANGHPGDLMTELFANETKEYLETNGYLKNVMKKDGQKLPKP